MVAHTNQICENEIEVSSCKTVRRSLSEPESWTVCPHKD